MTSAHTSVPRWDRTDRGVDPVARDLAILGFGGPGRAVAQAWRDQAEQHGVPVWYRCVDGVDAVRADLDRRLAQARVGFRLMLSGPEADVLRARAVATAAGLLDAELTVFVTGDRERRVWCSHCDTTTVAQVAIGGITPCSGCGLGLLVYHHVSRRHAAYLGFWVDAEDRP